MKLEDEFMEAIAKAAIQSAAEALDVEESRLTSTVTVVEDGLVIEWKLDGQEPTEEQIAIIAAYIRSLTKMGPLEAAEIDPRDLN